MFDVLNESYCCVSIEIVRSRVLRTKFLLHRRIIPSLRKSSLKRPDLRLSCLLTLVKKILVLSQENHLYSPFLGRDAIQFFKKTKTIIQD